MINEHEFHILFLHSKGVNFDKKKKKKFLERKKKRTVKSDTGKQKVIGNKKNNFLSIREENVLKKIIRT